MCNISNNVIQTFITGAMSNKFQRIAFKNQLTKQYLDTHIINQKSLIPDAQKTLLIKKVHSNMTQITIGFLDNTENILFDPSNIPYGVEISAPSIDNHIINLFDDNDSLIY